MKAARQPLRELVLFAGTGGGILGSLLLGHKIVGAVERDEYCCKVLEQRQRDGILEPFPIFQTDIRDFIQHGYASLYQGRCDLVSAGWPCQPHSTAGKRRGAADEREGWPFVIETIRQVRPRWFLGENVPGILSTDAGRYFGGILRDLAESGYDARWRVLSAAELGAPHQRNRLWLVAHRQGERTRGVSIRPRRPQQAAPDIDGVGADVSDANGRRSERTQHQVCPRWHVAELGGKDLGNAPVTGLSHGRSAQMGRFQAQPQPERPSSDVPDAEHNRNGWGQQPAQGGKGAGRLRHTSWWKAEPPLGRVVDGYAGRVDELKAIGNAQVASVVAAAWHLLTDDLLANDEDDDFDDLAAFWPSLDYLPDGVDVFLDQYGPPSGTEENYEREASLPASDGDGIGSH